LIKQSRRSLTRISIFGITYLHRSNPFINAWLAASFPGFANYMLNQYARATLFTLSEVIVNTFAHVNEAIVYTFCGRFEMTKVVLKPQWAFGYLVIWLFTIWDGYRSTITHNKLCELAESDNLPIRPLLIHPLGIQYLEQRNPLIGAIYSFFFPGLGQMYNHRFALAFYAMFWWWFYGILSNGFESFFLLLTGHLQKSIAILQPQWLLFMPSVIGGSVYHAFVTVIQHNRLFRLEQRQNFFQKYQNSKVRIFV
jgi:hypothetical protein